MKYVCDCGNQFSDLAGVEACQANNHGWNQPFWKEFGSTNLNGIYWISGVRPVFDGDIDDYGHTIGIITDDVEPFVSLAEVVFNVDDDVFEVYPIDGVGDQYDDYCSITHYADFEIPEPVNT